LLFARILLDAALFGAPLDFGAVIPVASVALGLDHQRGAVLWSLGSVQAEGSVWRVSVVVLALSAEIVIATLVLRRAAQDAGNRENLIRVPSALWKQQFLVPLGVWATLVCGLPAAPE